MKTPASHLSLSGANQSISVETLDSYLISVQVAGTFVGTVVFEATINGTDWFAVNALEMTTESPVTSATAAGAWVIYILGFLSVRVRCSVYTSGTINVAIRGVENGVI